MAPTKRRIAAGLLGFALVNLLAAPVLGDDDDGSDDGDFSVNRAAWRADLQRLVVNGTRHEDAAITVLNAYDQTQQIGVDAKPNRTRWRVAKNGPAPIPCQVLVLSSGGGHIQMDVRNAPADCAPKDSSPPPTPNEVPVAKAGPDQSLTLDAGAGSMQVTLNGGASSDPDGQIIDWTWTGTPDPADVVSPTLDLGPGSYTFALVVTDDGGAKSAVDEVSVTVDTAPVPNQPPLANAGPDQHLTLAVGQAAIAVQLDGGASADPDGQLAAWTWSGSPDPQDQESPTVTLSAGQYTFTLVVRDDQGASSVADTVVVTVDPAVIGGGDPHQSIAVYTGPETCLSCHEDEAREMHGSVHYQQSGPTDYVTNIFGPAGERWNGLPGEGFTGINTYCGTHENSPRFTCAGCHVGNGRFPKTPGILASLPPEDQMKELGNIDCLTCHQEQYKRFPDPTGQFVELNIISPDPQTGAPNPSLPPIVRTGLEGIPEVDDVTQDFQFVPADPTNPLLSGAPIPLMSISALNAARGVHATTRQSCLNCHAGAAGADGAKRGDLSSLLADPPLAVDMHMSRAGHGMNCADCHSAGGHRMAGRGVDLRPNDTEGRLTCESSACHGTRPHGDYSTRNGTRRDTHAGHIACQTCHIPVFGKGVPTEMARDWEDPHYSPKACNGRGGWLPREDKASDQVPSYAWFNGKSEVYVLGEPLTNVPTLTLAQNESDALGLPVGSDAYVLGLPLGSVSDATAKLHPMKEHLGKLARHTASDTLIGHSTFEFFRTGDFKAAVRSGMAQTDGMSDTDDFEVVAVHTFQSINHGVEVADNALQCGACHRSYASGGPLRMDLQGDLGYELKGNYATQGAKSDTCTKCHSAKTKNEGNYFFYIHDKHVRDKGRDCSTCHKFSRPERGLSTKIGD